MLERLFDIQVTHEFFNGSGERVPLSFNASPSTSSMLKRFGFVLVEDEGRVSLYLSSTKKDRKNYFEYITKTTSLDAFSFQLNVESEAFFNYTDLPIDFLGMYSYSSNEIKEYSEEVTVLKSAQKAQGTVSSFATVEILFSDLAENGSNSYRIYFASRKTQWEYFIINSSETDLTKSEIRSNQGLEFSEPKSVVLENGEAATLYTSLSHDLPLSEQSNVKLDLVNSQIVSSGLSKGKTKESIVFKGLPKPNPELIRTTNYAGEQIISSPIYVYV